MRRGSVLEVGDGARPVTTIRYDNEIALENWQTLASEFSVAYRNCKLINETKIKR